MGGHPALPWPAPSRPPWGLDDQPLLGGGRDRRLGPAAGCLPASAGRLDRRLGPAAPPTPAGLIIGPGPARPARPARAGTLAPRIRSQRMPAADGTTATTSDGNVEVPAVAAITPARSLAARWPRQSA